MRHFSTLVWHLNHIFQSSCLGSSPLSSHWTPRDCETVCMICMWIVMQPVASGLVFSKSSLLDYWYSIKTRSCISMSRWRKYADINSNSSVQRLLKSWNLRSLLPNNCQYLNLYLSLLLNKDPNDRSGTLLLWMKMEQSLCLNKKFIRSRLNN